jgi:hypothetical protein
VLRRNGRGQPETYNAAQKYKGIIVMHAEWLQFKKVGDSKFGVAIHGNVLVDFGPMDVDQMIPFVRNLNIVALTAEEVVRKLREGEDFEVLVEISKGRA